MTKQQTRFFKKKNHINLLYSKEYPSFQKMERETKKEKKEKGVGGGEEGGENDMVKKIWKEESGGVIIKKKKKKNDQKRSYDPKIEIKESLPTPKKKKKYNNLSSLSSSLYRLFHEDEQ